jgi:penicillin-binding protein 1C
MRKRPSPAKPLARRQPGRSRRDARTTKAARWLGLLLLLALPLGAWLALRCVPLPAGLFLPIPPAVELTDRHGRPLREVGGAADAVSQPASLTEIPQCLIDATLAAEDQRFWTHHGVDWRASLRATGQLLRHRRVVSGASTLTQQLLKQVQPRSRTLFPKLLESLQALRLEQVWSKQQILTAYLNRIDYGNRRRGCAAAAAFYFDRRLPDLSPAEAAFLAGLPQAPTRLNPHRHFERARQRQQWILARMRAAGRLTEAEYVRAGAAPLRLRSPIADFLAPHFADLVLQTHAPRLAAHGGGPLTTTLDLELQRQAEQVLRRQIDRLRPHQAHHGAVVILDVPTGDVRALVGSPDFFAVPAGQVNGAWARRSAGSTFKPFTYLIALEQGATPATIVADVPTEFPTPTGVFAPLNYDRRWLGPTRYRVALANSLNLPAVKVLEAIGGPGVLLERLQACGLTTLDQPAAFYGLGLTIGNAEARLLELANAYACLARLGLHRPYRLLVETPVSDTATPQASPEPVVRASRLHSEVLWSPGMAAEAKEASPGRRVFEAGPAWLVADILSDNAARARAFGLDSPLRFDFPVACKTGTSTAFRDNWAFGYTPEFVVAVWVGNFDGTPMQEVSGVSGAAPILQELMNHLHERFGTSWYPPPTPVVELTVHPLTGRQVDPARPDALRERFLANTLPPPEAAADYDVQGRVRLPAEYRDWFRNHGPSLAARAVLDDADVPPAEFRITQPVSGAVFVLDPDLPAAGRRLRLRAVAAGPVTWHSSTLTITAASGTPEVWLTEGRHEVVARDDRTGAEARAGFEVRRL